MTPFLQAWLALVPNPPAGSAGGAALLWGVFVTAAERPQPQHRAHPTAAQRGIQSHTLQQVGPPHLPAHPQSHRQSHLHSHSRHTCRTNTHTTTPRPCETLASARLPWNDTCSMSYRCNTVEDSDIGVEGCERHGIALCVLMSHQVSVIVIHPACT